jgi:hypothetical protein
MLVILEFLFRKLSLLGRLLVRFFSGGSSTARVTINGTNYDQAGPTSMAQGQTYTWSYPVTFTHNANGERAAIGVSVAFYVSGASFHDGSAGAGTQGALNYDRKPAKPASVTAVVNADKTVTVTSTAVSSPAGAATYYVSQSSDSGSSWSSPVAMSERTYTFSGLTLGLDYQFRVYATNSDGTSATRTSDSYFLPAGGRRLTSEGFVPTQTFKRLTAEGWVDVSTAKRLTAEGWVQLS